jgi:D-alanyl-D-alanine carboxypeptidase (penicillin-binding protein 5/6)
MFISANASMPLQDLVIGMSVVSANDAAVAIAEHLAGDMETFVKRMNGKARELGMAHTVFKNANGLPAKGQTTTARDILRLSKAYLEKYPSSLAIHSMQSYTFHNITQHNRNRLLKHYPGADGIKTGFIWKSGYNIAATAKRGDTRLLAVVLGARTSGIRERETARLLDEGFRMTLGKGG